MVLGRRSKRWANAITVALVTFERQVTRLW